MCYTRLAENIALYFRKNQDAKLKPKNRHLHTIAQLRRGISSQLKHILTIGKKLLNGNISSICPHTTLNFGLLTAEICWRVCGTPENFNGFRVLTSLSQRPRSTEVNQSLHYNPPPPVLVYCVYIFGSCCPLAECCHVQNSLCVHLRTIAQVCRAISSQLKHILTIGKNC